MATPNIVPRADSEGGLGTSSKYWASAYIDLIYVGAGKVGRDSDNLLDFSADNSIIFRTNNSNRLRLDQSQFYPVNNDGLSLGTATTAFSDLFLASGAVINFNNGDVTLTHSSGQVDFAGGNLVLTDNSPLFIGSGGDGKLESSSDDFIISQTTTDKDLIFKCDDGSGGETEYFKLDGGDVRTIASKPFRFVDGIAAEFGTGLDMQIYHNGSEGTLENITGNLRIIQTADDSDIIFKCDDGSGGTETYFFLDGSLSSGNPFTVFPDDSILTFGNSQDLQIKHDGTSFISNTAGTDLVIRQFVNDRDIMFQSDDGAGSVATYFFLDGSSATHDGSATTNLYTNWPDKSNISFGTGHDMNIKHDGSDSYIQNHTGNLVIRQNADDADIMFQCDDGSGSIATYLMLDGSLSATIVPDSKSLGFGTGGDLYITHDATNSHITNFTGDLYITNKADDKDVIFRSDDGSGNITEYFRLDGGASSSGALHTIWPDGSRVVFGSDSDAYIRHSGSDLLMSNATGTMGFYQQTDDGDMKFYCDDGSGGNTAYLTLEGANVRTKIHKDLNIEDNVQLQIGNSQDLKLYHNGSHSFIDSIGVGNLYITQSVDDGDIIFQSDDGSGGTETYFFLDGSVNSGSNAYTIFPDTSVLTFGDSRDLRIYHDGSNSYIDNNTGGLFIRQTVDDGDIYFQSDDGAGGLEHYFFLDGSQAAHDGSSYTSLITNWRDNSKIALGNARDLQIYHDGTNSKIQNVTGNLTIRNDVDDADLEIACDNGSGGVTPYITLDGSEVSTKILTQKVIMSNLPTSDPSNAGQLWNDSGTLKISAG